MDTTYNPWPVVLQGQQAARNLYDSEEEARKHSELLALRKAAGALGNQNYFAGYEGIPGAERPAALKEMWATGDPNEAAQLEALYSAPFKTQRGVETAGKIEAAKKASDLEYNKNMMREFFQSEGGQNANAFGSAMASASPTVPGMDAPTSPNVGEPIARRPPASLSATEQSFEVGPQGPKFGLKRMSPFEQSMKLSEGEDRRAKESRETVQGVHDNIRKTIDQIKATQQAMQTRDMPWEVGQQQIQQLQGDLQSFYQQRDVLMKRAAPSVSAIPAPVGSPEALSNRPSSEGVPRFTEKEQGAMTKKSQEERNTAANKEDVATRAREKGQIVVRSVIENLRSHYGQLNDMGGITNTEKGAAENLVPGISATVPGQLTGKLLGTKTQSLRNTIAQQRPLLMQAIMKATGMTAKQMDSNVELKLWLATATDPTLDYQSNVKALDMLEQLYGHELGTTAPLSPTGVAPYHDPGKEQRYQEYKRKQRPP